jgi:hypothetical protein
LVEGSLGYNIFTGRPLEASERAVSLGAAAIGLIPVIGRVGRAVNTAGRAGRFGARFAARLADFERLYIAGIAASRRVEDAYQLTERAQTARRVLDALEAGRLSGHSRDDILVAIQFLRDLHGVARTDDAVRAAGRLSRQEAAISGTDGLLAINRLEIEAAGRALASFTIPGTTVEYRLIENGAGVRRIVTCYNPCTVEEVGRFLEPLLGPNAHNNRILPENLVRIHAYGVGVWMHLIMERGLNAGEALELVRGVAHAYGRVAGRIPVGHMRYDRVLESLYRLSFESRVPTEDLVTFLRQLGGSERVRSAGTDFSALTGGQLTASNRISSGAFWTLRFLHDADAFRYLERMEAVVGSNSHRFDLIIRWSSQRTRIELKNWGYVTESMTEGVADQVLRDLRQSPFDDKFYIFSDRLRGPNHVQPTQDEFIDWFRSEVDAALARERAGNRYSPIELDQIEDNWNRIKAADRSPTLPERVLIGDARRLNDMRPAQRLTNPIRELLEHLGYPQE